MLIDIHTHHTRTELSNNLNLVVGIHALGLHPWKMTAPFELDSYQKKFREIKTKFNPRVLAIGECGLDRRREGIAEMPIQEKVLEWHMDWALEVKRPVIIHCVRSQSDLLKILKEKKYEGKIILHDFAGNLIEAEQFLNYDCYFSFGPRLFNKTTKACLVLASLSPERIFLETGDQFEYKIDDIYKRASEVLNIDQNKLEDLFFQNLKGFFSDLDNISTSDLINNLRLT